LLLVEGTRRTVVSGVAFPLRSQARYVAQRVIRRLRRRAASQTSTAPEPDVRVRTMDIPPGDGRLTAAPLELDTAVRRALAILGGHSSPDAMAAQWQQGDRWWLVGERPLAVVRLGEGGSAPPPVRELVRLAGADTPVEALLGALARRIGRSVRADLPAERGGEPGVPVPVREAVLPWPDPEPERGSGSAATPAS
jgi:hypothetical protein